MNKQTNIIILKQKSPLERGKKKTINSLNEVVLNAQHEEITKVTEV